MVPKECFRSLKYKIFFWPELWKAPSLILRLTKEHVCVQCPSLWKTKTYVHSQNKQSGQKMNSSLP